MGKKSTKTRRKIGRYEKEPMNTSNLTVGSCMNYKKLCEALGQSTYDGSQKKSQINNFFTRYFDFEKQGTQYIITEIYDEPLPAEYVYSGRTIYTKYTEVLLLGYLYTKSTYDDNVEAYLTNKQLWEIFGLGNKVFNKYLYSDQKTELVEKINNSQDIVTVTENDIKEQYHLCTDKFYQIVRSSLKSLEDRSLIRVNRCHMVRVAKEVNGIRTSEYEVRQADVTEESWILKASEYALEKLGFKFISQVQINNKQNSYNEYATEYLRENYNLAYIDSFWETYHIIYCADIIPKAVREDLTILNKLCINYELRKYLQDKNAKKTYKENLESNEAANLLQMLGCDDTIECKTKDYVAIGKVFGNETLDLGVDDSELLKKAAEIIKDKNMYKVYMDE